MIIFMLTDLPKFKEQFTMKNIINYDNIKNTEKVSCVQSIRNTNTIRNTNLESMFFKKPLVCHDKHLKKHHKNQKEYHKVDSLDILKNKVLSTPFLINNFISVH